LGNGDRAPSESDNADPAALADSEDPELSLPGSEDPALSADTADQ
jgi:hypothetical protein